MGSREDSTMRNLISLYRSPNIVREIKTRALRCAGHLAGMKEGKTLTGKPIVKRPLGRPIRRWEDNIRTDLKVIVANMRNSDDSAQDMDYWKVLLDLSLNLRVS